MNDPRELTGDELLRWLVVEVYRQREARDGITLLLHPWPPCPDCAAKITGMVTTQSPVTFDTRMRLEPCGHAFTISQFAIEAYWSSAETVVDQIMDTEAAVSTLLERRTTDGPAPVDRRRALAFNAIAPALKAHDQWLPLTVRKAVADAVLAAIDEQPSTICGTSTRGALGGPLGPCVLQEGAADRRYWTSHYDQEST